MIRAEVSFKLRPDQKFDVEYGGHKGQVQSLIFAQQNNASNGLYVQDAEVLRYKADGTLGRAKMHFPYDAVVPAKLFVIARAIILQELRDFHNQLALVPR